MEPRYSELFEFSLDEWGLNSVVRNDDESRVSREIGVPLLFLFILLTVFIPNGAAAENGALGTSKSILPIYSVFAVSIYCF